MTRSIVDSNFGDKPVAPPVFKASLPQVFTPVRITVSADATIADRRLGQIVVDRMDPLLIATR